ncbi:hypothetical protein [uncultured Desulfobacter sp.]|uniref:hypothetical protein n=1 Tax=uncultured Desulfobacter sp. TaxID=240139 RepID=UPI0029F5267C|nr:hypothetical protein [uncultured Desulfobacter sp.]
MRKKTLGVIVGLFLIVGLIQSGYAADSASEYNENSSNAVNVFDIYSKTLANLMQAAEKMGHSIEHRIDNIKIGIDEETFISFVLSDTFPDKYTDGEIVGFVDVSGFGDGLPDGQYGVKMHFEKKTLNKPSEFINITTGEQYLFETDTERVDASVAINTSEFSIKKGCTWIYVLRKLIDGTYIIRKVCLDCPGCYN